MADTSKLNIINSSRIIQTIWRNEGISRIQIAEELNIDRSTVTKIVNNLLDSKIVQIRGKETPREKVGRKPIGLSINKEIGVVLGIELQTQYCRVVSMNLNGQMCLRNDIILTPPVGDIVKVLKDAIEGAKKKLSGQGLKVIGIGIGLSGTIDPYEGAIMRSNPFNIEEPRYIKNELEAYFNEPILIENDANCCCWGEMAFPKCNRHRNFMVVLGEFRNANIGENCQSGIAVGFGFVVRERVLHGDDFTAGEFVSVHYSAPNVTQFNLTNEEAAALPEDQTTLKKVLNELVANMALMVNCFNFTQVVFAGTLVNFKDILAPLAQNAINKNWLYDEEKHCDIDFMDAGEDGVAVGAAGLFVEKLFSVPVISGRPEEEMGLMLFNRILKP